ncbi:MAG TPA: DMT family transporter [Pseudomonadaceae bacterium]|nr:DMT family transporter [Pseudomonadaceae bacterium]
MSASTPVRHWYGFFLSLLTAVMWGTLPIALQLLMESLDVNTITWARFLFSAVFVWLVLQRRGRLPQVRQFSMRTRLLVGVAILALMANFLLYLLGLDYLNPETTGIIIQLAPFLLMGGSVLFYGERMGLLDVLGALLLMAGLLLFFNERLGHLFESVSDYTLGVICVLLAAVTWSIYGLMQKALLRVMSSMQLTLLIYAGGAVLLLALSDPLAIFALAPLPALLLLFGCVNMVVGYGAFTEAMQVWQAAKVSAVIALAPVITILCMPLAVWWWPQHYTSSQLNLLSYIGAALVVGGSLLSSLGKRRT